MYNVVASFSQNKIAAPLLPILLKYGVRDLLLLQWRRYRWGCYLCKTTRGIFLTQILAWYESKYQSDTYYVWCFFPVECGNIPSMYVPNSDLDQRVNTSKVYKYEEKVNFSCAEGYELTGGISNGTIECLVNGNWSYQTHCEPGNTFLMKLLNGNKTIMSVFVMRGAWEICLDLHQKISCNKPKLEKRL